MSKTAASSSKFENPELDFYIGEEAILNSRTHEVKPLLRGG